eukprot:IDg18282t1
MLRPRHDCRARPTTHGCSAYSEPRGESRRRHYHHKASRNAALGELCPVAASCDEVQPCATVCSLASVRAPVPRSLAIRSRAPHEPLLRSHTIARRRAALRLVTGGARLRTRPDKVLRGRARRDGSARQEGSNTERRRKEEGKGRRACVRADSNAWRPRRAPRNARSELHLQFGRWDCDQRLHRHSRCAFEGYTFTKVTVPFRAALRCAVLRFKIGLQMAARSANPCSRLCRSVGVGSRVVSGRRSSHVGMHSYAAAALARRVAATARVHVAEPRSASADALAHSFALAPDYLNLHLPSCRAYARMLPSAEYMNGMPVGSRTCSALS